MEIPTGHKFKRGEKDDIREQAMDCLINDDPSGLEELFEPYKAIDPEVWIEVWYLFNSIQRGAMKKLLSREWYEVYNRTGRGGN